MKRQDKTLLKRKYGCSAEGIIVALQDLEKYTRTPKELFREFRILGERLDCVESRSDNPERIRQALEDYGVRLRTNESRGLPVRIQARDLTIAFQSEFSALCPAGTPLEKLNLGRRVYTGQTEVQGSNIGYGPMYKR